jgi:hypothetical protein
MDYLFWAAIAFQVFNALTVVGQIGKERKPITPGIAVTVIVISAAVVACLILGR